MLRSEKTRPKMSFSSSTCLRLCAAVVSPLEVMLEPDSGRVALLPAEAGRVGVHRRL
jgi:hypothetical protein